jgi:hypothetical protein
LGYTADILPYNEPTNAFEVGVSRWFVEAGDRA